MTMTFKCGVNGCANSPWNDMSKLCSIHRDEFQTDAVKLSDVWLSKKNLERENASLKHHVTELQATGTAMVNRRRDSDRTTMVREFHKLVGEPLSYGGPLRPEYHPHHLRYRFELIAEEFLEVLESAFEPYSPEPWRFESLKRDIAFLINNSAIKPGCLPGFIKETVDLDYVLEGTRIAFGVDSAPVWLAVHKSNMKKAGGPKRADGKQLKPEDWKAPDIEGELRKQGWRP